MTPDKAVWSSIDTASKIRGNKILTWGRVPESYGYSAEEWLYSISEWAGNGWSSQASKPFGNSFIPTHWTNLPEEPQRDK